jgi:hypothetical protein
MGTDEEVARAVLEAIGDPFVAYDRMEYGTWWGRAEHGEVWIERGGVDSLEGELVTEVGYTTERGWPAEAAADARAPLAAILDELGHRRVAWFETPTGWMMRPGLEGETVLAIQANHWHGGEWYNGTVGRLSLVPSVGSPLREWTPVDDARTIALDFASCLAARDGDWGSVEDEDEPNVRWWAANDRLAYRVRVFVESCGVVNVSVDAETGQVLGHDGIHNNCVE